jgi:imidazoleglycerol phosphate dehydratase HisB
MSLHKKSFSDDGTTVFMKGPGGNKCKCELMSVDCLDSIRCIRHDRERNTAIALGVLTRKVIKEAAKFRGKAFPYAILPLGKATQYATIDSWKYWTKNNVLPERYGASPEAFINHTLYAYCADHKLVGKPCFFHNLVKEEDLDTLEVEALEEYSASLSKDSRATIAHNVRADVLLFLSRSNTENPRNKLPALGLLMSFAHIARIHYNRQQPVIETYEKHFKTISPPNITLSPGSNRLRVSMHLRRADSCDHEKNDFLITVS